MEAPSPPELASMIISGVAETVELHLEPIRVELREKLRLPFDGIEWLNPDTSWRVKARAVG